MRDIANNLSANATDSAAVNGLLANIITNTLSGALGGLVGGESGATGAATADRFNRQLHPAEIVLIEFYADELLGKINQEAVCAEYGICNLDKDRLISLMTQSVLRNIDTMWADVLPETNQFYDEIWGFLADKAMENNYVFKGIKDDFGNKDLLFFTATAKLKENPLALIEYFKDEDYLKFIMANGVPEEKRDTYGAHLKRENEYWAAFNKEINQQLDDRPVGFIKDSLVATAKYLLASGELGPDVADFLEHYKRYTEKYLSDLDQAYLKSKGEATSGNYDNIFADGKNIAQLLDTIYGPGASLIVHEQESKNQFELYLAVVGATAVKDKALEASLKIAERKALEKAIKEAEEKALKEALEKAAKEAEEKAAREALEGNGKFGDIKGFNEIETKIIKEASSILDSEAINKIKQAHIEKKPVSITVNGRIIQYEPDMPSSGMSMFGDNGFYIGREAFISETEFQKTVLHELQRLYTSKSAGGAHGGLVTMETKAAEDFADRAIDTLKNNINKR